MSRNPCAKLEDGHASQSLHCKYVNWVKKKEIFFWLKIKNVYETGYNETGKEIEPLQVQQCLKQLSGTDLGSDVTTPAVTVSCFNKCPA